MNGSTSYSEHHEIVIVGAGISGLMAAWKLKQLGFKDVLILEARDRIGGRICDGIGATSSPVPMGAEFLHGGDNNVLMPFLRECGIEYKERQWPDWLYFSDSRIGRDRFLDNEEIFKDNEIKQVIDWFEEVDKDPQPIYRDMSALEWLRRKKATTLQMNVADAIYASDFSSTLDKLGLNEMIKENRGWINGDLYITLENGTFADLLEYLARTCGAKFKLNWPVHAIDYQPAGCMLHGPRGAIITAAKTIVTLPLSTLQAQSVTSVPQVTFSPPLPAPKQAAIARLSTGKAAKLILVFSKKFWPGNMYDVCCPGEFVPEMWMLSYDRKALKQKQQQMLKNSENGTLSLHAREEVPELPEYDIANVLNEFNAGPDPNSTVVNRVEAAKIREKRRKLIAQGLDPDDEANGAPLHHVTCFLGGPATEFLNELTAEQVVKKALSQLDKMFGSKLAQERFGNDKEFMDKLATDNFAPPSHFLVDFRLVDWSKDHLARGAYAFPCFGALSTDRAALASSVLDTLFFAGEATHEFVNPCVQGAAETGFRAALEVQQSVARSMSALNHVNGVVQAKL